MPIMVKKFGGSSVANIERIEFVADKIFEFYQQRQRIIVVVSAMKGDTDQLENLAYRISDSPNEREMAALLATGEQVVTSLLAMALIKRGCPASSYTGLQLGIETEGIATNARVKRINTYNIYQALKKNQVIIVAGFQGVDSINSNITTLGRGGSDTTAVALAIALNVNQCDIYTDVDGVYTADPKIVPNAKMLEQINFTEMLELSGLGAKVMQIRAVELGSYYNMPIKVLSSFHRTDVGGTLISNSNNVTKNSESYDVNNNAEYFHFNYNQTLKITSLNKQLKVLLINLQYKELGLLLDRFMSLELEIDMLTTANHSMYISNCNKSICCNDQDDPITMNSSESLNVTFVISSKNLQLCKKVLQDYGISKSNDNIKYLEVAKLSIIGFNFSASSFIFNKIYSNLNLVGIKINQLIGSETKVSLLLNEIDLELAIKTLHATFLKAGTIGNTANVY